MIKYFRPMAYDKLFFSTGLPIRQGVGFPLPEKTFKASKVTSAPYWRKVFGSTGIAATNISYAKLGDE